jgi:hypothetical protein
MLIGQLPLVVYLALLTAIVLLLVRRRGFMRGLSRPVTRAVWCPIHDRQFTATLEEEVWEGRRLDVSQCSAFTPATSVKCGKSCLRLTARPRRAASTAPLYL